MRIPQYESNAGLDTGAGTMRTPSVDGSVGRAVQSLGGQLSALGEHYQRQQEASQALAARQGFLELQNTFQADYRATVESAPENGAGLYDSWFVGDGEAQAGLFDQRAQQYLQSVPEQLQEEYAARLTSMRGDYEDRLARDQSGLRQAYAGNIISQQVEASALAIGQNPDLLDAHLTDVADLVRQSGLPQSAAREVERQAARQLALAAVQTQARNDPAQMLERVDQHIGALETRRVAPLGDTQQQLVQAALQVEAEFGIPAQDLLSIMSFETAGTLDPWKRGPRTQWGQHRGLIQWGEPQRQQYGVSESSTVAEQVNAAARYLMDRGYRPGMALENMYAAVLAGDANRTGVGDLHNGGVARSASHAVRTQFSGHIDRARSLLETHGQPQELEVASAGQPSDAMPDPILSLLDRDQVLNIQADARDALEESRRVSDYDATVFEQTVDDNIASIRETGRPIDGLRDEDVMRALGEDEFANYQRRRQEAQIYHDATRGIDTLRPDQIAARIDRIRAEPGTPGFEVFEAVRDQARDRADEILEERSEDPASAVRRIPEMQERHGEVDFTNPEAVDAFVTDALRWQGILGVPFQERKPLPNDMATALADQIAETQHVALRQGISPRDAMQSSVDAIASVFGSRHAEAVTMQAIAQMTGSNELADIAMGLFRRMQRNESAAPAETAPATDAIDINSINQGLEPLQDMGAMP